MEKRRIAILGSTGSVGRQAMEVIAGHSDFLSAELLVAHSNYKLLAQQAILFKVNTVVIIDENGYLPLATLLESMPIKVFAGINSMLDLLESDSIDMVLNAIVGFAGLAASLKSLQWQKPLALANKESMVVAGQLIMQEVRKYQTALIPVDSEPSAIFQCIKGEKAQDIDKVILTASGGPFLGRKESDLSSVQPDEALKHPTWKMGKKISIDSASLMNKGFEVIEAAWLFQLKPEQIEVVIHPQSIVHSFVQFKDNSIKVQAAFPDMRIPIQYALSYPYRFPNQFSTINFKNTFAWNFSPPDLNFFPNLNLAYEVLAKGGNSGCILNAANELAVSAFLEKRISFTEIYTLNRKALETIEFIPNPGLEEFIQTDLETRRKLSEFI